MNQYPTDVEFDNIIYPFWNDIQSGHVSKVRTFLKDHDQILRNYWGKLKPVSAEPETGANSNAEILLDRSLSIAIMSGQLEIAQIFLEAGASIKHFGLSCYSQVGTMPGLDSPRIILWLLEHGATVNENRHGNVVSIPLIHTAIDGRLEIMELLVEHGASLNGLSRDDKTALEFTSMFSQRKCYEYLRSKGALHSWEVRGEPPPLKPLGPPATLREHLGDFFGSIELLNLQHVATADSPKILRAERANEQFLFTDGVASVTETDSDSVDKLTPSAELLVQLPTTWPLTTEALADPNFNWPIECLLHIARWARKKGNFLRDLLMWLFVSRSG